MISSIVLYICLAATTFEITSSKKARTKRKKTANKGNSIAVLSNLKIKTNVELVRTTLQEKTPLPDRSKPYIKDLGNDIKQNGLKNPIILATSIKTERAYIYEGNDRIGCLVRQQC